MAGVPEDPRGPTREPEYEMIGGVIDDQRSGLAKPALQTPPHAHRAQTAAASWQDATTSFASWRFWAACALGIAAAGGAAAATVAAAEANGWFGVPLASARYLLMAVFMALPAAVLGAIWGFRHSRGRLPVVLLSGAWRGLAIAAVAGAVLLVVGIAVGGPAALTGAAVVVIVLEVVVFGLIGAGARTCFAAAAPGAFLATLVVAFLCVGNVLATVLLLPGTVGMGQASVPVNVQRDESGTVTAYECVGELRPVEVAHTDRVVWVAAANPALILGSIGADMVPTGSDLGWVLAGLQRTADGPSRDVPCLDGVPGDGRAPSIPVALTGLALQALTAALVVIPGRRLDARRRRVTPGSGSPAAGTQR